MRVNASTRRIRKLSPVLARAPTRHAIVRRGVFWVIEYDGPAVVDALVGAVAALGDFCEGDGECGTDKKLDNCSNEKDQGADIYRIVGSTPNYQPTRKPTGSGSGGGGGECVDDPTWCYGDCSPNDCAYVGQKVKPDGTLARCKEKNTDGERSALEACPQTCGTCN